MASRLGAHRRRQPIPDDVENARAREADSELAWIESDQEDARTLKAIPFEEGFALNRLIREACARRGVVLRETVRSARVDFILALIAAGGGIAPLPQRVVRDRTLAGPTALPPAGNDPRWKRVLAWRHGDAPSPAARARLALVAGKAPDL